VTSISHVPAVPQTGAAPPTVLALVADPPRVARLRSAFGDQLRTLESQPALVEASRDGHVAMVIVPWRDGRGHSLATSVAAIRASRRSAPVYVYAELSAECLRELMTLARAGARAVIVRDVDDDVSSLKRLLEHGTLIGAVESVSLALQHVIGPRQLPLLLLCLERIDQTASATECARRLRVSRRTLSAWAQKSGARGVRSLSSKCRVLTAIALLRESGRSVEHVAHLLRFASSAHLHNTIKRYTHVTPRVAVEYDVAFWSTRLFTRDVSAAPATVCLPRIGAFPGRNGPRPAASQHSTHDRGVSPEEPMT
jgi:AraC-like DNA-binding protein